MSRRKRKSTTLVEPFDNAVKTHYRNWFKRRVTYTETEREVFSRARKIDLVIQCNEDDLRRLQETVFTHLRTLNAIEFKGINDPLTLADYNLIQMRGWGMMKVDLSNHEEDKKTTQRVSDQEGQLDETEIILPSQRTITIVCVNRPNKILDTFGQELRIVPTDRPGIYWSDGVLPTWIIHPSELELIPANYPLLSLAIGKKLERFIELCIEQSLEEYLQVTLDVGMMSDPNALLHKLLEMHNMKVAITDETIDYIDQFFREKPEMMEMLPTVHNNIKKNVERLTKNLEQQITKNLEQQITKNLEQQITKNLEQQTAKNLEQREREGLQQGKQSTLLRLLQHRFGELPTGIKTKIESIRELDQLDQLVDQALDAKTLADIPFFL